MNIIFPEFFGSFQTGTYIRSEHPRDEAWFWWARFASPITLRRMYSPDNPDCPWEEVVEYAAARFRQAVELREATPVASVLTTPLTLYYAMLNLTRGIIAIRSESIPAKRHGLIGFESGETILACSAKFQSGGTCSELAYHLGMSVTDGMRISLLECIRNMPELAWDFGIFSPRGEQATSCVLPVTVIGNTSGRLTLEFSTAPPTLQAEWPNWFPGLAAEFDLDEQEPRAIARDTEKAKSLAGVTEICNRLLWPSLLWSNEGLSSRPRWWAHRRDPTCPFLPRQVYPLAAAFILSSAVRYEPEMMSDAVDRASEFGWLIRRILMICERYYPQLMTGLILKEPLYFG